MLQSLMPFVEFMILCNIVLSYMVSCYSTWFCATLFFVESFRATCVYTAKFMCHGLMLHGPTLQGPRLHNPLLQGLWDTVLCLMVLR